MSRHERELDMAVDKMLLYCSRQVFKEDLTRFLALTERMVSLNVGTINLGSEDGEKAAEFLKTGVK